MAQSQVKQNKLIEILNFKNALINKALSPGIAQVGTHIRKCRDPFSGIPQAQQSLESHGSSFSRTKDLLYLKD